MQIIDNKEDKFFYFSYDFYALYRVWVLQKKLSGYVSLSFFIVSGNIKSQSSPALFRSSHCTLRASGKCLTEKSSNFAVNPSPSGHAPMTPTMTG